MINETSQRQVGGKGEEQAEEVEVDPLQLKENLQSIVFIVIVDFLEPFVRSTRARNSIAVVVVIVVVNHGRARRLQMLSVTGVRDTLGHAGN